MKKYFYLLLVIAMLLTLVACGGTTAPPSDSGNTPNSTDAPTDSGTNTPPVSTQSQTPDASTSAPPAVAADISELTLNLDAISLSATVNSDDTVSYTYKDTSLKPAYVSDKAMEFYITVYGTDATSSPITSTFFLWKVNRKVMASTY